MTTHILYRMFREDGVLLYAGQTANPGSRLAQHTREREWWGEVAMIRLERFGSAAELDLAEVRAIQTEHPLYNVTFKPGERILDGATPDATAQEIENLIEEVRRAAPAVSARRDPESRAAYLAFGENVARLRTAGVTWRTLVERTGVSQQTLTNRMNVWKHGAARATVPVDLDRFADAR